MKNAVGLDNLVDEKDPDAPLVQYLAGNEAKLEKLFEQPELLKTPIVRNGRKITLGNGESVWRLWAEQEK